MSLTDLSLKYEERMIFRLRQLYRQYGYAQYRMSKFEEEVANRVKLRRRLSWGHIFREGDCYKDYGKGRA